MSNKDYSEYRNFFQTFSEGYNAQDPLPVRIGGYNITEEELPGDVINWSIEYLTEKNCPRVLIPPIIHKVLDTIETDDTNKRSVLNKENNVYSPLNLMYLVVSSIYSICQSALKNDVLEKILPSSTWPKNDPPTYIISSVKNVRRVMEDRYVCIDDFDGIYKTNVKEKTSFYGVFDGHAGTTAAAYASSHIHRFLANSPNYSTNPLEALKDAFRATDLAFIDKCNKENFSSGTTALCVLYRPIEPCLYVGWVGDSQALLVREGKVFQIVKPHKPDGESERDRIHNEGGWVMKWSGAWRVNGSLAVTRAIGDVKYKPYVTGEPDVRHVPLDGEEDFLVVACDGLWDYVTEDDVAINVYRQVRHNPDNLDLVTQNLVNLSKVQGSTDNITIIVVFLKDPHLIATSTWPSASIPLLTETMETAFDANQETQKNLFDMDFDKKPTTGETLEFTGKLLPSDIDNENYNNGNVTAEQLLDQFHSDLLNNGSTTIITPTVSSKTTNGKRTAATLDDEDDLGPETDVDAFDELMMSPKETKEDLQIENKEIEEDEEKSKFNVNNPFDSNFITTQTTTITTGNFGEENDNNIILTKEFDETNPFEDNKFRDLLENEEINEIKVTSDLVDRVTSELLTKNGTEKRDQSFEKDDTEFSSNDLQSIDESEHENDDNLQHEVYKNNHHIHDDDIVLTEMIQIGDENQRNVDGLDESIQNKVLETSAAAEHVVAESAGEDSEDEWNYIKGEKKQDINEEHEVIKPILEVEVLYNISQSIPKSKEANIDLLQQSESQHDEDGLEEELVELEKKSLAEFNKLIIDNEDEMSSQLNPDAKEFVPTSPVRSPSHSPFNTMLNQNGNVGLLPQQAYLFTDELIAQSPRKGTPMDDITLPPETEFDIDISSRPAELETSNPDALSGGDFNRPGSSSSQASYQEMNLKEAMHGDEKLEYAPEAEDLTDNIIAKKENINPEIDVHLEAKVLSESDPMNMSFYQDKENKSNPFDMNAVHDLPFDEDDDDIANKSDDRSQKIVLDGEQGERFIIEDSEFGMNDNLISQSQDEISKPEEDMYSPISENDNKMVDDIQQFESDKPESELLFQDEEPTHETPAFVQAIENVQSKVASVLTAAFVDKHVEPFKETSNDNKSFQDEEPTQEIPEYLRDLQLKVDSVITPAFVDKYVELFKETSNDNKSFQDEEPTQEIPEHLKNLQLKVDKYVELFKETSNDNKSNESGLSPTATEFTPNFASNTENDNSPDILDDVMRSGSPIQTNAIIETITKPTNVVIESVLPTENIENEVAQAVQSLKIDESLSYLQSGKDEVELESIARVIEQQSEPNDSGLEAESISQPDVEITDTISDTEKTESEVHENEIIETVTKQIVQDIVNQQANSVETPPPTPAVVDAEIHTRILTPEPQQIIEAVEKLAVEPHTSNDVSSIEQTPDEPVSNEKINEIAVAAAAAVAATTLAATAAVVVSSASKSPKSKVSDTSKSKLSTTKTSAKPSSTTLSKKTASPSTITTKPASPSTTTTKPATAKLPAAKPAPKPTTTSVPKPKSAPASHPPKTTPSITEKKISSVSNVIRKPLTNGEAKLSSTLPNVRKTTTTTKLSDGVSKISNGTVKSSTTTTRTLSSAPKTSSTTVTKTTVQKSTLAPKSATTTKTTTATKPPSTLQTKPSPTVPTKSPTTLPTKPRTIPATASSSIAATKTTTLSPTKPKTPLTSTNTDKLSKDTTNRARTASNPHTPTKTASSPRTTTTTVRKVADIKSPIGGTAKSKTTTTTTTTSRTSTVGVGAKKPTTTTRTSITKKTSSTTPISKSGNNDNKATTKVTTVKLEKQILNGDVISESEVTKTAQFDSNGELIIESNGLLVKDDSPIQSPDNSQMIVIDSAAD